MQFRFKCQTIIALKWKNNGRDEKHDQGQRSRPLLRRMRLPSCV
jgi:hypothetical protein